MFFDRFPGTLPHSVMNSAADSLAKFGMQSGVNLLAGIARKHDAIRPGVGCKP